jgi:hypothetical protein
MPAAWAAAIGAIGSIASSSMAPSQQSVPYNTSLWGAQNAMAPGYAGLINQQQQQGQQYYGTALPYAQQQFNQQYNNPYAQQMLQSGAGAGALSGAMGQQAFGAGQQLYGGANAIMQQGFDPQQALYNQQFQQMQDTTNAGLSQRGLADSGFGAGIANQANTNFQMDWQNQQLAREQQALKAAEGAMGQGGTQMGLGITGMQGVGQLPYGAYQQMGAGQNAALQNYYGNISPYFQQQGNVANMMGNYMGLGSGAQQSVIAANQNAAAQAQGYGQAFGNAMNTYQNQQWMNRMYPQGGGTPTDTSGQQGMYVSSQP